jgi:hypothetical protein
MLDVEQANLLLSSEVVDGVRDQFTTTRDVLSSTFSPLPLHRSAQVLEKAGLSFSKDTPGGLWVCKSTKIGWPVVMIERRFIKALIYSWGLVASDVQTQWRVQKDLERLKVDAVWGSMLRKKVTVDGVASLGVISFEGLRVGKVDLRTKRWVQSCEDRRKSILAGDRW